MNKAKKDLGDRVRKGRLMHLRIPAICFAAVLAAVSAQAQNPSPTVDSLASDLAALAARVAKLEGQITAADLAGTYALSGIQVELEGGNSPQVSSYVFQGTVVLVADGTATFNAAAPNGNTLSFGTPSKVSPFMGGGGGGGTIPTAWTYANGMVTVMGAPAFSVGAGGRIMISSTANQSDGTNVLLILVRLGKRLRSDSIFSREDKEVSLRSPRTNWVDESLRVYVIRQEPVERLFVLRRKPRGQLFHFSPRHRLERLRQRNIVIDVLRLRHSQSTERHRQRHGVVEQLL